MKDFMSTNDQEVRDETLMMQEEAHYHHTIHEFVELIVLYGWDTVQKDLRNAVFKKEW
jgi:hypothetical protein